MVTEDQRRGVGKTGDCVGYVDDSSVEPYASFLLLRTILFSSLLLYISLLIPSVLLLSDASGGICSERSITLSSRFSYRMQQIFDNHV